MIRGKCFAHFYSLSEEDEEYRINQFRMYSELHSANIVYPVVLSRSEASTNLKRFQTREINKSCFI